MDGSEEKLRRSMSAFQGRVVTAATHEFQNHLAVIKEYSGLTADLLKSRKVDREARSRCAALAGSINDRILQAAGLVDMLNRFTHRQDREICSFCPGEAMEELAALLNRQVRGNRLSLETSAEPGLTAFFSNPSMLQYLVFSLLEPVMDGLAENGMIRLSTSSGPGGALDIRISAEGAMVDDGSPAAAVDQGLVSHCLDQLSCGIDRSETSPRRHEIRLSLSPLAADSGAH